MKGDFSRIRFNPAKLYTAVLKQQGRVDLDSDANEQRTIDVILRETTNADIIGRYGGPADGAGFAITIDADKNIWISAGRYYVEGILVEISDRVNYDRQPYLIDSAHSSKELLESLEQAGEDTLLCFELEVWQRMTTALDDPCLLEPALGQADTTARLQTVWRVIGTLTSSSRLKAANPTRLVEIAGKMGAAVPDQGNGCGCQPIPAAGYQGLENQLYRVEIHTQGDLASATFKWSRENGSVVTKVTGVSGSTVSVASLGPDANLGFQAGQWVELSDNVDQFGPDPNQPGALYQIQSVDPIALQLTMTTPVTGLHKHRNPRMRRWDQSGPSATASGIPVSSTPIPLENGIQVDFSKGEFFAGDYWTIPARTANGSIDWPPCGGNGNHFQSASNIEIYRAPLASASRIGVIPQKPGGKFHDDELKLETVVTDLRSLFSPLAASAIHIDGISWTNAGLVTLDQLLANGLYVVLDTAPTSLLDAAVFRVTLEIVADIRKDSSITAENRIAITQKSAGANLKEFNANGSKITIDKGGTNESSRPAFRIGAALRQEYVLDGFVTSLENRYQAGWIVTWSFPFRADRGELIYALNDLLQYASRSTLNGDGNWNGIPAARVRVRLFGHMIFAEASQGCGAAKTIFLDGQCFGKPGKLSDGSARIALTYPSGTAALASDFESWFYLAPAATVSSVEFNPQNLTLIVAGQGASSSSNSGTTTGTVYLAQPALSDTTINLTVSEQTGITLAFSPTSVVIPAGQSSQTFTATVQATSLAPNGQATLTITATPELAAEAIGDAFSNSGQLYVTVQNPLAISTTSIPAGVVGKAYPNTTLVAGGGTPPYNWSFTPGVAVPARLALSSAGVLSGTPNTAGDSTISVRVTDSASPAATATQSLTLEIYAALEITTKSPLLAATDRIGYAMQLEATGGKPPYKWASTAGHLPSGLTLKTTGLISGTPDETGTSEFRIEAVDSDDPANRAAGTFSLEVGVDFK